MVSVRRVTLPRVLASMPAMASCAAGAEAPREPWNLVLKARIPATSELNKE